MFNQEIAKIFHDIALYFEIQNDTVPFRSQSYENAGINLEILPESVENIYKKEGIDGLKKIPGIGQNIAEKIIEYVKTGKIKEHQRLKKKTPVNIEELISVNGIGPKMIGCLYKHLKIKNLKDLEKAAKAGKIQKLPNSGVKTEQNILESIEFLKRTKNKFLLGEILPKVREIINKLKNLKESEQISEAGSVRRRKEIIGDIDILAVSDNPKKIMDFFVSLPGVIKIWGKGATKASVRMKQGFDIDIRVVPKKSYGAGLQYFTGSKEHNIVLRKIAIEKGLKLSEYGLFKKSKTQKPKTKTIENQNLKLLKNDWIQIDGKNEEEIYYLLGMDYIAPELRENHGEIDLALKHKLPKLVELEDIKGDLHCHSHWGAGKKLISEIAEKAITMGYEYIGISDHTKFLRIEHGLNEEQLGQQRKEINILNSKFSIIDSKFRILQGCEANILSDGSIDIKDEALKKLDYVIAGIHSQMKMPKEKMTERIIRAMKNPNVDIISHPTGRILNRREEYQIDFGQILRAAKEYNVTLEINACPVRLDLNDKNIRAAKDAGVKMAINTDAHQIDQMYFMEYGVSQARRGWAEKKDIINCWPMEKILK